MTSSWKSRLCEQKLFRMSSDEVTNWLRIAWRWSDCMKDVSKLRKCQNENNFSCDFETCNRRSRDLSAKPVFNSLWPCDAICRQISWSTVVQVPELKLNQRQWDLKLTYFQLDLREQIWATFQTKYKLCCSRKCIWNRRLQIFSSHVTVVDR